jgi:hypothetical protein
MEEKVSELVGPYTLVAALNKGVYRGVIWKGGAMVEDLTGSDIDDCLEKIRVRLGELLQGEALLRKDSSPSVTETVAALHRVLPRLSQGQLRMLRAHYHAKDRCMTATELADAAGYDAYHAANLQYGRVGWLLYGELPTPLPRRKSDGQLIYTCALAEEADQRSEDEVQWIWKMRPHVAEALAAVKAV